MRRTAFGALWVAAFVAAIGSFAGGASARPLTPAENRYVPWSGRVPACDDPSVLSTIQSRFSHRESSYWQSGLEVVGFDRVRETGYRSTGTDYIPRRYCSAQAFINDQKTRNVVYSVGEDLNFSGGDPFTLLLRAFGNTSSGFTDYGVDWCVVGLDRNYAYGMNCHAARP